MNMSEDEIKEYFRKSTIVREEYMKIYNKEHECCPKCGETSYITTLLGIPFDMNNPDAYQDINTAWCQNPNCKDKHTVHNRVPKHGE